jgi:hypothetical protein
MKTLLYIFVLFAFIPVCYSQTTNESDVSKKETKEIWRELADKGKYHEAINILLDSIQTGKPKNKNGAYWHVGQLYAFNNEYDCALKYMKESTGFFNRLFDREWRLYYKGTIAFLKRDKKKLGICNDKLWNKHSGYYSFNAHKLKALYENFDKSYKVAYEIDDK